MIQRTMFIAYVGHFLNRGTKDGRRITVKTRK